MPGRLSQLPVITRLPAFIGSALVAVGATFVGAPGAAANDTAGAASASAPVSIALPGDRAFPESLASTKDGTLYVGSLASGGKLTKLTPSRQLVRADALRRYGKDRFLLIEGGGRLDMLSIRGDNVTVETLEDGYVVPTGVSPVGRTAWVSEGQLSFVSDPDKKPNLPFHIYSVDLPAAH
jgi:hypothetical protein